MKTIIAISYFIITTLFVNAQSWNPYVNEGLIEPAPMLPIEFEGSGGVLFNIGNSGSSVIEYDKFNPENNLILIISLHNGKPNKSNPMAALRGNWKGKFSWTYDESTTSFIGIQKTKIFGYSQGTLEVAYKVSNNTSIFGTGNGFNVEMIVPAYMAGNNHSADDKVSSFTFTRAYDQGDAPESYGAAKHEINLIKDEYSGTYSKYLYLGESVDQEPMALTSVGANGDDNDNLDDEDGVSFPELIAGSSVTIPVRVTTEGNSWGILNAWFDWNADGDFMDAGEKANTYPIPVYSSGTIDLAVTIPENAVTGINTYARFRLGGNSGPISISAWGEVEDYQIRILSSSALIVDVDTKNVSVSGGSDGWIRLQVSGGNQPYQYLWDNGLEVKDIENLMAGDYSVTISDANNNIANRVISIYEPSISWEFIKVNLYPNPVGDVYHVTIDKRGSYLLELIDMYGRLVSTTTMEVDGNEGRKTMYRNGIMNGQYILRVTDKSNLEIRTLKILMTELESVKK